MTARIPALSDEERESCAKLAKYLDNAFDWDATPQGHPYWRAVHRKLELLSYTEEQRARVAQSEL